MTKEIRYCDRCHQPIIRHFRPDSEVAFDRPIFDVDLESEAEKYSAYMCRKSRVYELCPACDKSFKVWFRMKEEE